MVPSRFSSRLFHVSSSASSIIHSVLQGKCFHHCQNRTLQRGFSVWNCIPDP
eukprot:12055.XXX_763317_765928_1 [CDS] Oithona nana genome sequencing.